MGLKSNFPSLGSHNCECDKYHFSSESLLSIYAFYPDVPASKYVHQKQIQWGDEINVIGIFISRFFLSEGQMKKKKEKNLHE